MGQVLLLLVVALTVAAVVLGVTVLVSGRDPGLVPTEPDGRAVPLPGSRPLDESDVSEVRFDTALRGYRMAQVDAAMRRAAYDIGYKSELIGVLEAENTALREGRTEEADALRRAREEAAATGPEPDPSVVDPTAPGPVTIDLSAPAPGSGVEPETTGPKTAAAPRGAGDAGGAREPRAAARPATLAGSETDAGAGVAPAEAGVAEAPAAAAVEDTTSPGDGIITGPSAGSVPAAGADDRERGPVVRSESA
ncbi:DivIVA domain-containing protein [Micromonospora maritima]|uniref:DivIVA domain-containing protein n=1 Tax=Micromonospora maritima TaxID=986711 RepID=UPI00157D3AFE|nr:DivIVA domain-containing protein [Micromonospora maritima]